MPRMLLCALVLSACATAPKPREVADCVNIGFIGNDPRSEIRSETQTSGPSHVIWFHPPAVERGYFKEVNRYVYRCPTPR